MIYATEQQVVVTAVLIVFCTLVALFTGMWWGHGRGLEHAAEEQRWEREQAKARRVHAVYRQEPDWDRLIQMGYVNPPEVAHEDQALAIANGRPIDTGEIRAITDRADLMVARWKADNDIWMAEHGLSDG